ncbi:MAG: hypothetical protein ACE14M_00175 [Terriglobales bacterium]
MKALKVISLFLVAGLCSAAASLFLGWLYLPSLFFFAGLALFLGLAAAFGVACACGWLQPPRNRIRCWEALGLIVLGYPAAELFGTIMSLFCEALLYVLPPAWHEALKSYEPVPMIGLLSFWGSLAAAFCVNSAIMVISERWSNRTMVSLSIAGTVTTIVAMAVYAPNYTATEGFAAKYRELVLFGVLLPLGDVLFSVITGYALATAAVPVTAEVAKSAAAARG